MITIYSHICFNFRILGENGDERAKGEWTREKRKFGTLETRLKLAQTRPSMNIPDELAQDSSEQIITHLDEMSLNPR